MGEQFLHGIYESTRFPLLADYTSSNAARENQPYSPSTKNMACIGLLFLPFHSTILDYPRFLVFLVGRCCPSDSLVIAATSTRYAAIGIFPRRQFLALDVQGQGPHASTAVSFASTRFNASRGIWDSCDTDRFLPSPTKTGPKTVEQGSYSTLALVGDPDAFRKKSCVS